MRARYDAIALFSGGLDSLLAVKAVQEQGLAVLCLHCVAPFFGKPDRLPHWRAAYGLEIACGDVGEAFVRMLRDPEHGYGKMLNPCVDCKILMLREAAAWRVRYGARHVLTGEVLGQRPMSQRRDTLNIIRRESGLGAALLRPLSAQLLPESAAGHQGEIDLMRLPRIAGRGRSQQLLLAERYGIRDIPTPAGGCRLTERENVRRYHMVLTHVPAPVAADFALANIGRQLWGVPADSEGRATGLAGGQTGPVCWLSVGRHQADNAALVAAARAGDVLLRLLDVPGPVCLVRFPGVAWPEILPRAAALTASFSPRAVQAGGPVRLCAQPVGVQATQEELRVIPCRDPVADAPGGVRFSLPAWEAVREALHTRRRARELARGPATRATRGS